MRLFVVALMRVISRGPVKLKRSCGASGLFGPSRRSIYGANTLHPSAIRQAT